ncbi:MAG TPA: polymer-forming cytoskeletal protein, partial [Thermoanaerobaculia bacterium]|nr:polymer-forming cytoskeletal protein [Thermoanaerobaculia bacterium]
MALVLCLPAPGAAQPPPPSSRPAAGAALSAGARRELRDSIERLYQVTGIHNGVLLKPRVVRTGVHEVEVSGDSIIINGARVMPEAVREWLRDAGAAQLLQLLELSPADRQALFGLPRDVAATASSSGQPGSAAGPAAAQGADAESREDTGLGTTPPMPPVPPTAPTPPVPPVAEEPPVPPGPPSPPPAVSSGSRVRFGGPVTVGKDEVAEEVVTIGGGVHIDGEVNRDVSAVGGSVRVNGRVGGSVTAVAGSVHLGPHSEVMGDVRAVGGTVVRAPGSVVHGSLSDVSKLRTDIDIDDGHVLLAPLVGRSLRMFWSLATLLLLLLAVTLVVLLAPNALEQVRARVAGEPWTTLGSGFLGVILVVPALVTLVLVLIISIIGCLLLALVPFLIIGLFIAALVGFAGVAYQAGRVLEGRFGWHLGGPYLTTVVGVLAIYSLSLVGHLLAIGGGFLHFLAMIFLFFGGIVRILAWIMGFGAAILTVFANRPQRFRRQPPPSSAAVLSTPPPAPYATPAPPAAPAPPG